MGSLRPKKTLLSLDVDSALALMQEIYNDVAEQKNQAALIMKKMYSFMKESEDMSILGPVIKEQQKILNECTEKKISLVKLQSSLIKQMTDGKGGTGKIGALTDEDRKYLETLMNNDEDNSSKTEDYKI